MMTRKPRKILFLLLAYNNNDRDKIVTGENKCWSKIFLTLRSYHGNKQYEETEVPKCLGPKCVDSSFHPLLTRPKPALHFMHLIFAI